LKSVLHIYYAEKMFVSVNVYSLTSIAQHQKTFISQIWSSLVAPTMIKSD